MLEKELRLVTCNLISNFRIRLIVSSTDISEEAELKLTSKLNQTIKNYWVALGKNQSITCDTKS